MVHIFPQFFPILLLPLIRDFALCDCLNFGHCLGFDKLNLQLPHLNNDLLRQMVLYGEIPAEIISAAKPQSQHKMFFYVILYKKKLIEKEYKDKVIIKVLEEFTTIINSTITQ